MPTMRICASSDRFAGPSLGTGGSSHGEWECEYVKYATPALFKIAKFLSQWVPLD